MLTAKLYAQQRRAASTQLHSHQKIPQAALSSTHASAFDATEHLQGMIAATGALHPSFKRYKNPLAPSNPHSNLMTHRGQSVLDGAVPKLATGLDFVGDHNYASPLVSSRPGGLGGYLLPNIVKKDQSPAMKPFVTKTTKNIKKMKQKSPRGGQVLSQANGPTDQLLSTEYSRFMQEDMSEGLGGGSKYVVGAFNLSTSQPFDQQAFSYQKGPQSKSVLSQPNPRFSAVSDQQQIQQLPISPKNTQPFDKSFFSPTGGSAITQAELSSIYNPTFRPAQAVAVKQQQGILPLNATNCLIPVSENEDLQIKAALVNLKKLKLDIDMKKELQQNSNVSKKESGNQIFSSDQFSLVGTTDRGGQQSNIYFNRSPNTSRAEINDSKLKFREIQMDTGNISDDFKFQPLLAKKGLQVKINQSPVQPFTNKKQQQHEINFSKYKQLKQYNDSLMKIQQELHQVLKNPQSHHIHAIRIHQDQQSTDQEAQAQSHSINAAEETVTKEELTNRNPYLLSVSKDLTTAYNQFEMRQIAQTEHFQYDHRQLIPKKTITSTKKTYLTQYRKSMMEESTKDEALTIGQANLKKRYPILDEISSYDAERPLPSVMHDQTTEQSAKKLPDIIPTVEIAPSMRQNSPSDLISSKQEVHVVIQQNQNRQHQHTFLPHERSENIRTLKQLNHKKSSTLSSLHSTMLQPRESTIP